VTTRTKSDVLVIGAGVSGLSTALSLIESGLSVTIRAADLPQRTTSMAAGAIWGAHLVGVDQRVRTWSALTLNRLRELAADPATGIRETRGLVASLADDAEPPEFTEGAGTLSPCDPAALPAGYAAGWQYSAPVVAMPVYLDYLTDEFLRAGGELHLGSRLRSLADAADAASARVIVNCTGIGARQLVPDPELTPVRGQSVVLANPGLTEFFVGETDRSDEIIYFFPHGPTILLGGTQQPDDASTEPDPAAAERIVRDCAMVEPRLATAPILAHRVGLRPVRPQVRLEVQAIDGERHIVHNYGHGGAGVTLSWGCARAAADEAVRLLG
jgi:D-amino-acid oxidase